MTDDAAPADDDRTPSERMPETLDAATVDAIEEFANALELVGMLRMEGRILSLLIIVDAPYLSSQRIRSLLHASAGGVSMATRNLVAVGFLRKHSVPGDRQSYFRAEDDVWGSFLAGERDHVPRIQAAADRALRLVGDRPSGPRTRLENAKRYSIWLAGYHRKMLADWQQYRDEQEDGA